MEYMEQQMDNLIQSGIDEREWLYSELATIRAENERLREALNEIVSVPSADGWVPSLQHCVDVAKEALK